jgi:benzodiazapine receptor
MSSTSKPGTHPSRPVLALICFFALCYAVAGVAALSITPSLADWYATLSKPSFNPPDWVFAPVWTALYGFMAIAAWLVWRSPRTGPAAGDRHVGLILFAVQLIFNGLWAPVFFAFHLLPLALILILCLWGVILATAMRFWKVDRFAAGLMIPYLLWVGFASFLTSRSIV